MDLNLIIQKFKQGGSNTSTTFSNYNVMSPTIIKRTECDVYCRCVGWITPVKNYNKGKAAEYKDRKVFILK